MRNSGDGGDGGHSTPQKKELTSCTRQYRSVLARNQRAYSRATGLNDKKGR